MCVWLNLKPIKFYLVKIATDFYWQPSYLLGERASLLSLLAARRRRRGKRAFDFIDWLHEWRHNNRQNDTQRVSPKIIQLWRRHDTQHNGLFAALYTNKTQYNNTQHNSIKCRSAERLYAQCHSGVYLSRWVSLFWTSLCWGSWRRRECSVRVIKKLSKQQFLWQK